MMLFHPMVIMSVFFLAGDEKVASSIKSSYINTGDQKKKRPVFTASFI